MGYWNSRGLRGSTLEEIINVSNDVYKRKGLAIIQKIPTPIKPIEIDAKKRTITLAYFEQKSTVDYIGAVQGIPVCFDAKETSGQNLSLQNIHLHQIEFMDCYQKQGGVAFLLVHFTKFDESYLLPFDVLHDFRRKADTGGRKSIPYSAFDKDYLIKSSGGVALHYLEALNKYLQR